MANTSYEYQKPQNTYTIDQYINCKSDTLMCYYNTSFIDNVDNLSYSTHNVVSDYLDELRDEYCVTIELDDDQLMKYKYRPKLLCYDIYGNTELHFIIMLINDMYSIKQFTKKTLLMPTVDLMKELSNRIMNADRNAIQIYAKNNTTTEDDE